eukprot:gene21298-27326_t
MLYEADGHRKKDFIATSFKQPEDELKRYLLCLYGEHLLDPEKKKLVIIVESEKSAVIAAFFYPQFDWVACAANTGLTDAKIPALFGRQAYKVNFTVVDLFPSRTDGYDIADYIIEYKDNLLNLFNLEDALKNSILDPDVYPIEPEKPLKVEQKTEAVAVFIKYRTEDEQENVSWILEIRKAVGENVYLEVLHDEFCSARKLKSMLAARRLGFKIKDGHLDELHSYLFTRTEFNSASKVVRYGYHTDSGVFFFSNKAFNVTTGGAGTGKSSMIRVLTAAFGRKQEGVNLKGKNTDTGLVKLMSQAANTIIWFDEFHNELPNEGLLQAAYDNDGYHKSSADFNSIDTASVEIHSALGLTSNYIPSNPIFFSRCLFVPITEADKSDVQKNAYDELKELEEGGLGCMTVELLKYRELLTANDNYNVSYNRLYNGYRTRFKGQKVPERLFSNMSQTTDEAEILKEYIDLGEDFILRQFRIQNDSKAAAEFFEIIQQLFDSHQINEEVHFRFTDSNVEWAAQQILTNFSELQIMKLEAYFAKLNEALYKSWGKEMSFEDLFDAVKIAQEISNP